MPRPQARSRSWLLGWLVVVAAIALYLPTWGYDYTHLDDDDLILEQQSLLREPSSLYRVFGKSYFGGSSRSYYRPLVNLSFVVDAQWSGARAMGYHLDNTVLHAVASVLVLALLLRLRMGELPSVGAALWFAVHPVHGASVAWIPGRNDVLMTAFALGAALWLLEDAARPRPAAKLGHLACLGLAFFSKETALCLPLLLGALLWLAGGRSELRRRWWMWIGWATAAAVYFGARFAVLGLPDGFGIGLPSAGRVWPVLLSDLGKLLLPVKLQVVATPEDSLLWPGLVVMVSVAVLAWAVHGVRRERVALGALWVTVPILVGLLGAQWVVLENRLYLAVVGASLWIGEALRALLGCSGSVWRLSIGRKLGTLVATGALLVFAFVSLRRSPDFRDRERFIQAAMAAAPHSGLAAHLLHRMSLHGAHAPAERP